MKCIKLLIQPPLKYLLEYRGLPASSAFFVVIEAFMYGFLDYLRDLKKTE